MQLLMIDLLGHGKDLSTLQICIRAFIMFFVALIMIRLGGLRIFGKKTAFDDIVSIMLGALLSRGITGAAPFGSVIVAGILLVLIHRFLSLLCIKSRRIAHIINGKQVVLYNKGKFINTNLLKCSLSENEILESLRLSTHKDSLSEVETAYMENNGDISFILKKEES